jgi:hypothetical protein
MSVCVKTFVRYLMLASVTDLKATSNWIIMQICLFFIHKPKAGTHNQMISWIAHFLMFQVPGTYTFQLPIFNM